MKKIAIDDWSLEEPPRTWRGIIATMAAIGAGSAIIIVVGKPVP